MLYKVKVLRVPEDAKDVLFEVLSMLEPGGEATVIFDVFGTNEDLMFEVRFARTEFFEKEWFPEHIWEKITFVDHTVVQ